MHVPFAERKGTRTSEAMFAGDAPCHSERSEESPPSLAQGGIPIINPIPLPRL